MENNENNGKYDDYPFPAGRMSWNGFVLVLIEAIIDDIFSPQTRSISTPGQGRVGFALSQWVCCYDCFHKAQTQWQANGRSVNQQ